MKEWLRRYLGLDVISNQLDKLEDSVRVSGNIVHKANESINVHSRAVGRIIAKLDPNFGLSEFDPVRKAESDKLGDEVIKKLRGEFLESNKYGA